MNPEIVRRIFASLQALEKQLATVKERLPLCPQAAPQLETLVPQQEAVLRKMRRLANLLQLYVARNDIGNTVRTMKLFYGLNHMVRSDILAAHGMLAQPQATPETAPILEQKGVVH